MTTPHFLTQLLEKLFMKIEILYSAIGSSLVILAFIVLVLALLLKRKKDQKAQAGEIRSEDLNPVYGMYYFSNGGRIDERQSEVTDGNEYYAN